MKRAPVVYVVCIYVGCILRRVHRPAREPRQRRQTVRAILNPDSRCHATNRNSQIAIHKTKAQYSDEAAKACFNTDVLISVMVDRHGHASKFRIVRPAGVGLDEQALSAARQWKFRPASKGGRHVASATSANFEFRILCGKKHP